MKDKLDFSMWLLPIKTLSVIETVHAHIERMSTTCNAWRNTNTIHTIMWR